MAISSSTFSNVGGAVNDLFAGFAAQTSASLKASGLRIGASSTRIGATSTRIGADQTRLSADQTRLSATGQRMQAEGLDIKAQGDLAEASEYDLASALARGNEAYTAQSTTLKQLQADREVTMTIGSQRASVSGAGLRSSGGALDLLRDSASQGAISKAVLGQQGLITEAGFEEQAKSYDTMAAAGRTTAAGETDIANQTRGIADRTDVIAGKQDIIAGQQGAVADQQDAVANQQDVLAQQTEDAGKQAATGDFISGAIKGVAAIATLMA